MFKLLSNFQRQPKTKQKEEKWQLFHAKNFQSLMYPCFTFCRFLGIFPYKINGSNFKASKPCYILSTVIICVCYFCELIKLYWLYIIGKMDMNILPVILERNCFFIFGGFIITITFILSGPRMRLLQIILKISSSLSPESYKKLSRLIHVKDITGFFCPVGFLLAFYWQRNILWQIDTLFDIYIILVVCQMDMLYMNCVCVLTACFKRINDNLMHIQEFMANDEPHIPRLIYHKQKNPFLIMELNVLKKQHLIINDTVQMLNTIFSLQLVTTIVMTLFDITFNLYNYIQNWNYILNMNTLEEVLCHLYLLLYVVYFFIKTVLIVWACETGKNQALQIGTSIHDVINSTTDEQIHNELQLFSLQILHCENIFSVKYFTVDAKLLAEMIGVITTYILIIFQFKTMTNSCERTTTINVTQSN